jgi:hypothetical protein
LNIARKTSQGKANLVIQNLVSKCVSNVRKTIDIEIVPLNHELFGKRMKDDQSESLNSNLFSLIKD